MALSLIPAIFNSFKSGPYLKWYTSCASNTTCITLRMSYPARRCTHARRNKWEQMFECFTKQHSTGILGKNTAYNCSPICFRAMFFIISPIFLIFSFIWSLRIGNKELSQSRRGTLESMNKLWVTSISKVEMWIWIIELIFVGATRWEGEEGS